ncbi:hypothetical protein GUITHDRAFT_100915 [Guillardia theta CCMP2712]|uniref:PLAT domain-containing protein n=1 Tax=Guillardia theta (strain CCMP2712) TaxID=905079 RepID=L1JYA7_GUITC|nr:hypothetical protein GUITHDRAFT_100915 [Guillardia theta CCMP2712]EKX53205.1 hypothetical protein GUITHDRAFT_100915 [Guillardia theta CCMP2712]|eukprot:XP_005840185.1 hypothetical protein GUITHDRAFT_100915 [Guillardia theta CCMP2712]
MSTASRDSLPPLMLMPDVAGTLGTTGERQLDQSMMSKAMGLEERQVFSHGSRNTFTLHARNIGRPTSMLVRFLPHGEEPSWYLERIVLWRARAFQEKVAFPAYSWFDGDIMETWDQPLDAAGGALPGASRPDGGDGRGMRGATAHLVREEGEEWDVASSRERAMEEGRRAIELLRILERRQEEGRLNILELRRLEQLAKSATCVSYLRAKEEHHWMPPSKELRGESRAERKILQLLKLQKDVCGSPQLRQEEEEEEGGRTALRDPYLPLRRSLQQEIPGFETLVVGGDDDEMAGDLSFSPAARASLSLSPIIPPAQQLLSSPQAAVPSQVSPISRAIRKKLWEVKWERPEQQEEELRQISSSVSEVETEVKAQARAIEEASKAVAFLENTLKPRHLRLFHQSYEVRRRGKGERGREE